MGKPFWNCVSETLVSPHPFQTLFLRILRMLRFFCIFFEPVLVFSCLIQYLVDVGARRLGGCLQNNLKWVRLPSASLSSTARLDYILPRCLSKHLVEDFVVTLPNCRRGVHDGPKVAMSGDRLVNGSQSLSQTKPPVNGSLEFPADTDGRNPRLTLHHPSLGHFAP